MVEKSIEVMFVCFAVMIKIACFLVAYFATDEILKHLTGQGLRDVYISFSNFAYRIFHKKQKDGGIDEEP